MKKFYSLLAAAAIVASASAAAPREMSVTTKKSPVAASELSISKTTASQKKVKTRGFNLNLGKVNKPILSRDAFTAQAGSKTEGMAKMSSKRKMKVLQARKADGNTSVEGTWTFSFGDYYFQSSAGTTITATYESTLTSDGYLVFEESPATGYFLPFVGEYNAANSTISFSREYLSDTQDGSTTYSIYQQPFEYNWNTDGLDDLTALVGNFNSSTGILTFTSDQGIAWEAYVGSSMQGYFDILDFEGATFKGDNTGGDTGGDTGGNTGGNTGGGDGSIEGDWTFTYYDVLYQSSTGDYIDINYTCSYDNEQNIYWFEDPTNENLPFGVYFDKSTNVVTVPAVFIGSTGTYIVSQEPFVVDMSTEDFDFPEELSFRFDPASGSMVFDENTGITWGAYDPDSYEYLGDFAGYYFEEAVMTGAGNGGNGGGNTGGEDSDWTDIGNATFMDGWVLPAFGIDQTDESNWYEVPAQQNKTNPNLYRLVNPFMYGPAVSYNTHATKQGYIEFDVTDPDHVTFSTVEAGFANGDTGISKMYCMNTLAFFATYYNYPPEYIISVMGNDMPYTTYKNGVVDLSYIIDEDGKWYDACFGMQGNTAGGYQWKDQSGAYIDMSSRITLPVNSGVGTIENADDVKVEYFNLQGVRVANPEKGQIVIRVTNGKVDKMVK